MHEKDWGYITGVVELDLINVQTGIGGGFVYAKNEHGELDKYEDHEYATLTALNRKAVTRKDFTYKTGKTGDYNLKAWETSGNFVHNVKQIVDDCYPTHNSYIGTDASPAHYWYIKGSIYVYDQYISAYTGSATSYSETVSIPLSIRAGAHGRLTLREVQPNLYAYYDKNGAKLGSDGAEENLEINGKHYELNEPISYWDWSTLTADQQLKFVEETYTVVEKCKVGNKEYPVGYTMLSSDNEYTTFMNGTALAYDANTQNYKEDPDKNAEFFLRLTNNVSHDTGYVLTFDMDNPGSWNDYFTKTQDLLDKITKKEFDDGKKKDNTTITPADYTQGPTYRMIGSVATVYGQKYYNVNDVIDKSIVDSYGTLPSSALVGKGTQATFEQAWVTTQAINVNGATINPGVAIVRSEYSSYWDSTIKENVNVVKAKLITSTLQLSEQEYLYAGDILSEDAIKAQIQTANPTWNSTQVDDFYNNNSSYIGEAYYCTSAGNYGGQLYLPATAYEALQAWSAMSKEDRTNFRYNYDALDLLIDPTYGGTYGYKPQYDGYAPGSAKAAVEAVPSTATAQYDNTTPLSPPVYSPTTAIDYTAIYNGDDPMTIGSRTIQKDDKISREEYEAIPNEKYHYSPITVTSPGVYYVVKEAFIRGDIPYTVGEVISKAQYDALDGQQKPKVDVLTFPAGKAGSDLGVLIDEDDETVKDDRGYNHKYSEVHYYYCRDPYEITSNGGGTSVTTAGIKTPTQTTYSEDQNQTVPLGIVIDYNNYKKKFEELNR